MLQFYKSLNAPRQSSKRDCVPMIARHEIVPPFQLVVPWSDTDISRVDFVDSEGQIFQVDTPDYTKYRVEGKDVYVFIEDLDRSFTSDAIPPVSPECGIYSVKITMANGDIWYSNRFQWLIFDEDEHPYLKIEWTHDCSMHPYIYEGEWIGKMYLDSELIYPEYQDIDESELDVEGNSEQVLRVSKKDRLIEILAGDEPLADTFRWIMLNNTITITSKFIEGEAAVYTVEYMAIDEIEWNKEIATFFVRFNIDDNIVRYKCCKGICPEAFADVYQFRTDAEYDSITPSIGETYFISQFTSDDNEWTENAGSLATWNGTAYTYKYVPKNTILSSVGFLYFVNPEDGLPLSSVGYTGMPEYIIQGTTLYGSIPPGTVAVMSDGRLMSSAELLAGVDVSDLAAGSYDIDLPDVNNCGTWNTTTKTVTVL